MDRFSDTSFPVGTVIRTGVPAERPEAALRVLCKLFAERDDVVSAKLVLMEAMEPDKPSEFTYAVGIEGTGDENEIVAAAVRALLSVPEARWPISFMRLTSEYFGPDAIVIFERKGQNRGWFSRLFSE